jgi:hypothetical protein
MKKYKCTVCGYIYDPEVGDTENGVAAGTAFEVCLMIGFARIVVLKKICLNPWINNLASQKRRERRWH